MTNDSIKTVAVMGAGTMGNGIAHVFARAGYNVILRDVEERFLQRGMETISKNLDREIKKGKLPEADKPGVLARLKPTTDMGAIAAADFAVEAVPEKLEVKRAVLTDADKLLRPDVILASNTSSISMTALAAMTQRPERFVGMHFMNPVPMMVLVEDKRTDNNKQEFFYDRVKVGGKIRVFGTATKLDDNPKKLARAEKNAAMPTLNPEELMTTKADNYHRWFGTDWGFIERVGKDSQPWGPEAGARLKKFVTLAHSRGYLISFYSVNGFSESENQGWTDEFNFGSRSNAEVRWKAARAAGADLIATDQYEDLARVLKSR